ncbi:hypothetical protein [Aliiglaciecola litoralis]|uniref:Uncharacterized protein n=1 Tax=Aliiglaciecola litoralis TaxID=582857 RepID=A0ABN1LG87_9ALTE
MSFSVANNVNSAIISGTLGLNRAQTGITQASLNIAQRNAQAQSPTDVLANAAVQQIGQTKQLLPQGGDSLTNNLLSLQINSFNAQASGKVLEVASGTVGRIIDELV